MQNQQLTDATEMVNQISPFGTITEPLGENEFVEKVNIQQDIQENKIRKAAEKISNLGRNKAKKAHLMLTLKQECPDIDLLTFAATMCNKNFESSFENLENLSIAKEIEDNLDFKKVGKALKKGATGALKASQAVTKVATSKIGKIVIGGAATVIGSPALAAAVNKGLDLTNKAQKLGLTKLQFKKAVANPTKAQEQALIAPNALTATLAPLIPLEGTMKKALAAKGVSTSVNTSLEDLTAMFYDRVVKNKSSFETNFDDDVMSVEPVEFFEKNYLDFSKAGLIVNDIVSYFKTVKKQPVTPVEQIVAKDVKQYEAKIQNEKVNDIATKIEQSEIATKGFSTNAIIMVGLIAVALILIFR